MSSYFEQLTDHYKQVRARLNGAPPPPWRQPETLPAPEPPALELEPELEPDAADATPPDDPPPPPQPEIRFIPSAAKRIAREALKPHGMTLEEALGPSRRAPYITARTAVYVALRRHGWSLKKIAIFCNRDHTTVLNALHPKEKHK